MIDYFVLPVVVRIKLRILFTFSHAKMLQNTRCIQYILLYAICMKLSNVDTKTSGLLYPCDTETREVRDLNGIWSFYKSADKFPMQGVLEGWYKHDLTQLLPTIPMPVPASYNDITTDALLRDHVGTVWYQRTFFPAKSWAHPNVRVWLRFGSIHYAAVVWLNGQKIVTHTIGHLPFEVEITNHLQYNLENRLIVLCDNTLTETTVPQGQVVQQPSENGEKLVQTYTFDFFNYAGIHRTVHLYTTPFVYIEDIDIKTDLSNNNTGIVHYKIIANNRNEEPQQLYVRTKLLDKSKNIVAANVTKIGEELSGVLIVENVNVWWPYLMHPEPGYLYTLEIFLHSEDDSLLDVYREKVGIRTLSWTNTSFLINSVPLYLHGFGRHEDSDFRGKGLDNALLVRDFNLLKWIGANVYRTSHYPYSEESMKFADENGIMIIDECSSVNTNVVPNLLTHHMSAIEQLIHRDKNHASVIMWSIANEPRSASVAAQDYFRLLTDYLKVLDCTRPITAAINVVIDKDYLAQFLDIISFNRYNAWYQNPGQLDTITHNVIDEATAWHRKYEKPILMTEYGADTLEGLHFLPTFIWAEDYQYALLGKHFKAFDTLREQGWFIGELVWNFADFKTEETYNRVGGNKKGIFTRNRQPKSAAYLMRQRYFALAYQLYQCKLPDDLFTYFIDANTYAKIDNQI